MEDLHFLNLYVTLLFIGAAECIPNETVRECCVPKWRKGAVHSVVLTAAIR